jgi:hydroxymethylpyrimidine pyrophosphatase-like HAD family hydrolase
VPLERMTLGYDGTVVASFEPYLDRVEKIVAASADAPGLERLEQTLNPMLAPTAQAVRSQPYYLDITHARANKGDAVEALARHIGVPLARTATIGDGANDVPMFLRAGLSIAMGQADAAVREHATLTTLSNAEDGLAAAIERVLLRDATA